MFKVIKSPYFYLLIIILLGLILRLYKIDSPIADWHSWRQADTASVTRNFIKEGFNPFYPKGDDMSGIAQNPLPNTGRFRFVEFPIYNMTVYPLYLIFGVSDTLSRLVSVIFSLGSIVLLYFITKRYLGVLTALLTCLYFAVLPFNVFFSRTTLPEPTLIFFSLGMVYFVDRWIFENKKWLLFVGLIFMITAFLIKPWAIFFFIPLIYSLFKKYGKIPPKRYLLIFILGLLPFLLWRVWIMQHPEGIPASDWLYNGDHIRFRPAFWWWLVQQRIGGEILGVTGAFLFFLGVILKPKNGNYFFHIWALSFFAYFVIFATGNVRHNYYQIIFVPIACIFVSIGFISLIKGINILIPRFWTIILSLLFLSLSIYFTWNIDKEFYKINNPAIIEAGKVADQILPINAIVLAPYNGDTAFLYQTNRAGWPVTALPTPELVAKYGVTHYISTSYDDKTNWVMRHFLVLKKTDQFLIADLTKITKSLEGDPEP